MQFKPKDFDNENNIICLNEPWMRINAAERANEILFKEVKNIKVDGDNHNIHVSTPGLFNIIFKEKCKHENVPMVVWGGHFKDGAYLKCECGAKLKPIAFEEI